MKDYIRKDISIIQKSIKLESPILRHYIRKHNLSGLDAVILGVLIDLTGQRKTDIRTHYNVIASHAGVSDMEAYQSINSLHRYRIIDTKPVGNFIHISFTDIGETIEEIDLAEQNAKKIKKLESDVSYLKSKKFVPSDELFDIMMPLIGRIIRKKLSEALKDLVNYINSRIESLTSFTLWKYRFQSYRTGIPLAEIVFRNSIPYLIEEVLLIDRKTSVLLAAASWQEHAGTDRDIVAAMLSAVKDFIKTSFNKEKNYLNEISFGDSKILISESVYFYSAVLIYGHPEEDFFNSLDSFINSIHVKFRQKLKKFKGNMDGLEPINILISDFINKTNTGIERRPVETSYTRLKAITAVCAAVIAVSVIIFSIGEIRDYLLEKKILKNIENSLPAYVHDIDADVDGETLTLTGSVNSPETGDLITKTASAFPEIKNIVNKTVTSDFRTVEKFTKDMSAFENKFKDLELLFIKQELEKIVIEFPSGVSAIGENQTFQIKKIFEILKGYPDIDVDIIAFNDTTGGLDINRRLANDRMNAIRNNLSGLGINKDKIHITDFNPDVINADHRYRDYKNTRGIILFARRSGN